MDGPWYKHAFRITWPDNIEKSINPYMARHEGQKEDDKTIDRKVKCQWPYTDLQDGKKKKQIEAS